MIIILAVSICLVGATILTIIFPDKNYIKASVCQWDDHEIFVDSNDCGIKQTKGQVLCCEFDGGNQFKPCPLKNCKDITEIYQQKISEEPQETKNMRIMSGTIGGIALLIFIVCLVIFLKGKYWKMNEEYKELV